MPAVNAEQSWRWSSWPSGGDRDAQLALSAQMARSLRSNWQSAVQEAEPARTATVRTERELHAALTDPTSVSIYLPEGVTVELTKPLLIASRTVVLSSRGAGARLVGGARSRLLLLEQRASVRLHRVHLSGGVASLALPFSSSTPSTAPSTLRRGGCVHVTGGSTLVLKSSTIEGCHADAGGALALAESTLIGVNATILSSAADLRADDLPSAAATAYDGGCIVAHESSVRLERTLLRGCSAPDNGGGLFAWRSRVLVESSAIEQSEALGDGGAICTRGSALLAQRSGFSGCKSEASGGALHVFDHSFAQLLDTDVTGCEAAVSGGGLDVDRHSRVDLLGGTISGNRAAASRGPQISGADASLRLPARGGGVQLNPGSMYALDGTAVHSNSPSGLQVALVNKSSAGGQMLVDPPVAVASDVRAHRIFVYVRFDKVGSSGLMGVLDRRQRERGWGGASPAGQPATRSVCHYLRSADHCKSTADGEVVTIHAARWLWWAARADAPSGSSRGGWGDAMSFPPVCAMAGRPCQYFTLLREPVARLRSAYSSFCLQCSEEGRHCGREDPARLTCPNMSLAQYASYWGSPYTQAFANAARYSRARPPVGHGRGRGNLVDLAESFLVRHSLVLVTEHHLRLPKPWADLAGWMADPWLAEQPGGWPSDGRARGGDDGAEPPPAVQEALRDDLALYARIRKRECGEMCGWSSRR